MDDRERKGERNARVAARACTLSHTHPPARSGCMASVQNGPLFVRCGCAIASGTRRNAKWNEGRRGEEEEEDEEGEGASRPGRVRTD